MMGGKAGNGGGGDTEVLDGGRPPLGSLTSDNDATQSGEDNGALYDETQPETQLEDGLEEEEDKDDVAGDWADTQLVESGEEDGSDDSDQVKMQLEVELENGEEGDDDSGAEDNAHNCNRTQLDEECEVDEVNNGVGSMVETQLVEDSEDEEDGVNGSDQLGVNEWGKTQLVEYSDEEIGDDELSDRTQVLSDNESLSGDERDVKSGMDKRDVDLGMGRSIEGLNGEVEKLGGNTNLVESDASTDEEGDTGSGHIRMKLPSIRVASVRTCGISGARDTMSVNVMHQGKQNASSTAIHPLPKIVDESISCSASFGGIDNDSHGYVQNHDKDETKSRDKCSTAKKLFADMTAEDGESNSRCFAGLSYIGSQEPGDLSQANAFDVVDRLISINGGLSSQETTPIKLEVAKPRVSKRGTLLLAEKVDLGRSSNGKAEIFEWVDSREDAGGGDFFSKNKDILLQRPVGRGKQKSHSTRAKNSSTKKSWGENKIGESNNKISSKLPGKFGNLPLSDSRLLKSDVESKRASGNRSKKNLFKDLDDLSNAKSLEEQEKDNVAVPDVGPDTQMAVEAMEALVQCSPAKGQPLFDRDTRAEKSRISKRHSKNGCPQKRTSSIQEGVTTRSKRRKETELDTKPQKEKMQENSERIVKMEHKQTKPIPRKSKVSKKFINENQYHGTPVAHRTRHCGRNDPSEFTELCSNKHLRGGKKLTGDSSTVGEVQFNHIANNPEKPLISERTTECGSNHFEKERTKHTCANEDQELQQSSRDGSTQRTSVNNVQNLVARQVEPTIDVACRDPPSHPKQRRTPTTMVQPKSRTAANHETPPEVARPSKKRRIFVRSVSDLLKYAKREPSNGRSASMLSSIIEKSLAASPTLNSSVRNDGKTSDLSSSAQRLKESSHVDDTSKTPKNNAQVQNSVMNTPTKVVKELSPTFSPANPSKGSNGSLSKSSVARELLKLNHQRKDSRRRKDMATVSILLGNLSVGHSENMILCAAHYTR